MFIFDASGLLPSEVLAQFLELKSSIDERLSEAVPMLVLLSPSYSEKQSLYQLGMIDYLTSPVVSEEVYFRIYSAFHYSAERKLMLLKSNGSNWNRKYDMVKRAKTYLLDNIDKEVSLEELSRCLSTNRSSLSDAFKEYSGTTIFTWLRVQRFQKAALMLETTALSVTRISEDVGYGNSNNFSAAFKKEFALSPLQYRKQKHNNPKS